MHGHTRASILNTAHAVVHKHVLVAGGVWRWPHVDSGQVLHREQGSRPSGMRCGGRVVLPTGTVKQLIVHRVNVGVADGLVTNLDKPGGGQPRNIRHRDCGVRS